MGISVIAYQQSPAAIEHVGQSTRDKRADFFVLKERHDEVAVGHGLLIFSMYVFLGLGIDDGCSALKVIVKRFVHVPGLVAIIRQLQ